MDGPVRTRPRPSARAWPVRTFSHLTHIYLFQTQAHSTDQVYWVCPTHLSYALVVTADYRMGSSYPLRPTTPTHLVVDGLEGGGTSPALILSTTRAGGGAARVLR
eukprot:6220235-Prymnesium_polylepis.1